MKEVIFIHPNPNKTNPRGIRINNIVKNLKQIASENNYSILSFSDKLKVKPVDPFKINSFNLIYLLFRYTGIFKLGTKFSKLSRILDPFIFIHFLIKLDIKLRLKNVSNFKNVVFVVVVSPFSNYLLVPWLREKYPNSRIICDIGDPLYKNSARWNNDEVSKNIEREALNLSTNLIVTNESSKKHFISEFNLNPTLGHVIPQGVNTELIEKISKNCRVQKEKSMAYAGRFYSQLRSPQALFDALSSQDYFTLDVYGDKAKEDVENVYFQNRVEQEELFRKMSLYEVLVFIDNKSGIQTSGKIFELLAFKKIILFIKGDEETETYKLANKFQNVIFCNNNKDSISKAISKIKNFRNVDFNYDCHYFSWHARAEHYLKLL